jgi:hypothetical protein
LRKEEHVSFSIITVLKKRKKKRWSQNCIVVLNSKVSLKKQEFLLPSGEQSQKLSDILLAYCSMGVGYDRISTWIPYEF